MKGIFITFEGIEGAGKSTQAKLLYDYLNQRGYRSVLTKEPGGTKTGQKIRKILLSPTQEIFPPFAELFLYEADRNLHVNNLIKPSLENGYIVICDRYIDSTLAYQGFARGLDKKLINYLNEIATEGVKPDITFLIDIPVEEGLKRIKKERNLDRIEQENINFHIRLREGFLKIADQNKDRIVVINGLLDKESIFSQIKKILKQRFNI